MSDERARDTLKNAWAPDGDPFTQSPAYEGPDRRSGCDQRSLDIAREAGREAALTVINAFTVHDLKTHDGRESFKADLRHGHTLRVGCEKIKSTAGTAVVRGGATAVAVAVGYAVWSAIFPHLAPK